MNADSAAMVCFVLFLDSFYHLLLVARAKKEGKTVGVATTFVYRRLVAVVVNPKNTQGQKTQERRLKWIYLLEYKVLWLPLFSTQTQTLSVVASQKHLFHSGNR